MRAVLGDLAVFNHENLIGLLDGRQPVGNRDDRLAARELGDGLLDEVLVFGVDARGRLIEDDNGRVLEDGPRDGRTLIALFEKLGLCGGVKPVKCGRNRLLRPRVYSSNSQHTRTAGLFTPRRAIFP